MTSLLAFIIGLIETLKYFGIFIGTFIEGPAVGMITGSLIKLGYLNIYLSYLVYIIGDFTADCLYYSIGYHEKKRFFGKFIISTKTINKARSLKNFFSNHQGKIVILGKLTHFFGLPILIGAGLARYPWKKFLFFDFIATLIKSAVLIFIGYYFTYLWVNVNNAISIAGLIIILLVVIIAIVYYFIKSYKKIDNL